MITPSFGLTATERVLPKLALDFTTASLDSRVTFTRALATATRVNASGYIQLVAADTPRFDYDPVTLICKGLLIEEARTNVLLRSNLLSDVIWSKVNAAISTPAGLSPDGTQNINRITFTGAGGNQRVFQGCPTSVGTTYTLSLYVKGTPGETVTLEYETFIISVVLTSSFVRYSVSGAATAIASSIRIISRTGNTATVVDCYGGQFEAGAFATSYIPTDAGTVLRNADVATMTGANFTSWYNASEGAFEATCAFNSLQSNFSMLYSASNGSNSYVNTNKSGAGGTTVYSEITDAGAAQATINNFTTAVAGTTFTAGFAYKVNSFAATANGGTVGTDSLGTVPATINKLDLGSRNGSLWLNGYLIKIRYWPQRITNAELQAFSK